MTAKVALDLLATALGPGFSTTFVRQAGRRPLLAVADRRTGATTEVSADDGGWLWWPWHERIAPAGDPLTAAYRVTAVLRGAPAGGRQ